VSADHLPLRWGTHDERVAIGLTLIAGGLAHLQAASTTNLWPLAVGSVAHTLGWLLLPARAWRRLLPIAPSLGTVWLLLSGPQALWTLAVPYLGWLLARDRPWLSLITLGPVLLTGVAAVVVWREYDGMIAALALGAVVTVGCAWWAAALDRAPSVRARNEHPAVA
jgi:hypothetical protein